jgi:hypothetical protein
MSNNYLWDKSGEPDEEVQHLEALLSDFRYQPRPLVLPEATPKRTIFSYFQTATLQYAALAAGLLLALGVGLWLTLRPTLREQAVLNPATTVTPTPTREENQPVPSYEVAPAPVERSQTVKHFAPPKPSARARKIPPRAPNLSQEEEGEIAKEKVLYALQITSEKLDLIAKRIQPERN